MSGTIPPLGSTPSTPSESWTNYASTLVIEATEVGLKAIDSAAKAAISLATAAQAFAAPAPAEYPDRIQAEVERLKTALIGALDQGKSIEPYLKEANELYEPDILFSVICSLSDQPYNHTSSQVDRLLKALKFWMASAVQRIQAMEPAHEKSAISEKNLKFIEHTNRPSEGSLLRFLLYSRKIWNYPNPTTCAGHISVPIFMDFDAEILKAAEGKGAIETEIKRVLASAVKLLDRPPLQQVPGQNPSHTDIYAPL